MRQNHTASLLGTGEILVAGGDAAPQSSEIIAPFARVSNLGPNLAAPRASHTATMLLSGKVLLAGGTNQASSELYDPITRSFTVTGSMSKARAGHVAVRLRSGRVLVVGGAGAADPTCELYDPDTGTWTLGPVRQGMATSAIATLADGRVMVVGGSIPTTEIYDPSVATNGTWSIATTAAVDQTQSTQTLTRLFDDSIALGWTQACTQGALPSCSSFTDILSANATMRVPGPMFSEGRTTFGAVRTTSGTVLFIGGFPDLRDVEALDPDDLGPTLDSDGETVGSHEVSPTSTMLPGGDIVVVGGGEASIDRRSAPGIWDSDGTFLLLHAREQHSAARLHDGRVLVVGGVDGVASNGGTTTNVMEAEILDLRLRTTTGAGNLVGPHQLGTATTLRSGDVLVAGGGTANAELFTGAGFIATAPMSVARSRHAATLLPSGKVLVVGGTPDPSAELFDPDAQSWTPLPNPMNAYAEPGAVLMANGLVLVTDNDVAELFDPVQNEFRATTPPDASHEGRTAHILANGGVFVAGGGSPEAEIYDPATATWQFTSAQSSDTPERLWTALPDGRLVMTGGHERISGVRAAMTVFDPIAHPLGTFLDLSTGMHAAYFHSATMAGNGQVVATGGQPAFGSVGDTDNAISIYHDDAPLIARPTLGAIPTTVVAGTKVELVGSGFANGAEASDGTHASSAVNHPIAMWVSDAGDAVIPSTILDFTDTTATWVVPTTVLHGHGQLFVAVAGVMSDGQSTTIAPAAAATTCTNDAQCDSGFCTDGVCCDQRCDAKCEGCSKARKLTGADGVCGAVPPGQDIAGRCILDLGVACTAASQCGSGFCAGGVCCDSLCDGQCLSCNQQGKVGQCSAINQGACGAACDGEHTLKQVGVPDVDCTPYKCSGPQCLRTCASVRDCVAPAICDYDGNCVPPTQPSPPNDSVCGCRVVGARAPSGRLAALAMLLFGALIARRRRG